MYPMGFFTPRGPFKSETFLVVVSKVEPFLESGFKSENSPYGVVSKVKSSKQ